VDVAGRVDLETGPVVVAGGVVGARRGGARAVEAPRLGAGDDPAHDGPEAADVLVALAVAEPGAAGLAVVAVAVGAPAGRAGAPAGADAVGPAAAAAAAGVAVHVVAGSAAAELGAVDLPPAAERGARRAAVGAGDRAAELGVSVVAERVAGTHRGVGRAGAEGERGRSDRQRGARHRPPAQDATPVHP